MNTGFKIGSALAAVAAVVGSIGLIATNANTAKGALTDMFDLANVAYVDGAVEKARVKLAGDLETLRGLSRTIGKMTADTTVGSLMLQLRSAKDDLEEAERDLAASPGAASLQQYVATLREQVTDLQSQIETARCYRTEIISEQDQDCNFAPLPTSTILWPTKNASPVFGLRRPNPTFFNLRSSVTFYVPSVRSQSLGIGLPLPPFGESEDHARRRVMSLSDRSRRMALEYPRPGPQAWRLLSDA